MYWSWVAVPFSRESSQPWNWTQISHIEGGFFTPEPREKPKNTGVGSLSLLQGTSWHRNRTGVSWIVGGFFTSWATRETLKGPILKVLVKQTHYCYFVFNFFFKKIVQFCRKKVLNFLILFVVVQLFSLVWLCGLHHARLPLSFTISWNLHKLISIEFVMPSNHFILCALFSSCPQSFPAGSFPVNPLFASGGQSIGVLASASVLSMNIQSWFPLGFTGLISLLSKGLSRVFSSIVIWKHQFFSTQPFLWSNSHIHEWLLKKTIALTIQTFVSKMMSLLFFFKKIVAYFNSRLMTLQYCGGFCHTSTWVSHRWCLCFSIRCLGLS